MPIFFLYFSQPKAKPVMVNHMCFATLSFMSLLMAFKGIFFQQSGLYILKVTTFFESHNEIV